MTDFASVEELMQHQLEAKERWRRELAALPIEEKMAILARMQKTGLKLAKIREAHRHDRKA
jgi:hypothetical protein